MIAIITAMEAEFRCLQQHMLVEKSDNLSNCALRGTLKGKDVVVIRSGIGQERSVKAIGSLLNEYAITYLISTGVAGALSPVLMTGDIVISEKVLSDKGTIYSSDRDLMEVCIKSSEKIGLRHFTGLILTASNFVKSKSDKMKLHMEYQALAVDMESAFIAEYANRNGIPFLAVRSISDRADTSFNINFQKIKRGGAIDPLKSLIYFSIHPLLYLEFRKHRKTLAMSVGCLPVLIGEIIERLN